MHTARRLVHARLQRFVERELPRATYRQTTPLDLSVWPVPGEPVSFMHASAQRYAPVELPWRWGPPWSTAWLRLRGTVPPRWLDADGRPPAGTRVECVVDLGFVGHRPGFQAEALAFTADGTILKGVNPRNSQLPVDLSRGPDIEYVLEAAANPGIGNPGPGNTVDFTPNELGHPDRAGTDPLYRLVRCDVALLDLQVWELDRDIFTLTGLMDSLPESSPRGAGIAEALGRMLDLVDPDDLASTAAAGRAALREVLAAPASATAHRVLAVGHAHIDSAWLWPQRETVRKCARTFANVVALMDADPLLTFACSSAQQLCWIRDGYPELFASIRAKVAEGRFVPVGGMWVESDTNMPGGEALARQFVQGKRFFAEEFGIDTAEVWLPDSFGYSAALPQIMAASGSSWLLAQKLTFNDTNTFPHSTFRWEGIDGTRFFTHSPPVDTYLAQLSGAELAHAEQNFKEQGRASVSLVPFGWGDGGGGPTREMLAAARRTASLEGSPRVTVGTPQDFYELAHTEYDQPPVWSGELYLETHRGVYTSQARTKRGNRTSEHLLREAELWAATAAVILGADYPYEELTAIWRTVLFLQFHDILPGSSINWVYRDAERDYRRVVAQLSVIIERSLAELAGVGDLELVANAAPHPRDGVPALGLGPRAEPPGAVAAHAAGDGFVLDNGRLQVRIDGRGLVTSLVDRATGRDAVLASAPAGLLQLHRDRPDSWDAWDINRHYRNVVRDLTDVDAIALEVDHEQGFGAVTVLRSFGASTIRQRYLLGADGQALELELDVDWHESEKLLKLAVPLDLAAEVSRAETQFGHVSRPTHTNTSWDEARYEICAHRWIHVGEHGYGVGIANDSTYGHDVTRTTRDDAGMTTTVRLSLLRAPLYPDLHADQGEHHFAVSIQPGATVADTVALGYRRNLAVRTVRGSGPVTGLVEVSNPAVVVECVKLAEDRSGDVIVRCYESLGGRAQTGVTVTFASTGVTLVDLLERLLTDQHDRSARLQQEGTVQLRPFELVTLRFAR